MLRTGLAGTQLLAAVHPSVSDKTGFPAKRFMANAADKGSLTSVAPLVGSEVWFAGEVLVADAADVRNVVVTLPTPRLRTEPEDDGLLVSVRLAMSHHRGFPSKSFLTDIADEGPFASVHHLLYKEVLLTGEVLLAYTADVRNLATEVPSLVDVAVTLPVPVLRT